MGSVLPPSWVLHEVLPEYREPRGGRWQLPFRKGGRGRATDDLADAGAWAPDTWCPSWATPVPLPDGFAEAHHERMLVMRREWTKRKAGERPTEIEAVCACGDRFMRSVRGPVRKRCDRCQHEVRLAQKRITDKVKRAKRHDYHNAYSKEWSRKNKASRRQTYARSYYGPELAPLVVARLEVEDWIRENVDPAMVAALRGEED